MEYIKRLKLKSMKKKNILHSTLIFIIIAGIISCQSTADKDSAANSSPDASNVKTEISKTVLDSLAASGTVSKESLEAYKDAKEAYLKNTNDPDALIWYGRRTAYLGQFQEAIEIYTTGIQNHPKDARMYRHRGHRYITLREYDEAIKDFETAVKLIENQVDQIEPDGLPNERNIPLTTLHGNIWYHLGLAYYLQNDLDSALEAFSNRTVTEKYPDNMVSGGHWQYMILRRMGKNKEANAAISEVTSNMDIIENMSYYKMCQFYKGILTEEDLKPEGATSSSNDVLTYGLGNWYLYHKQDTTKAKEYYKDLLENGNKYSFAYLTAEADWNRIFKNQE
jgi:TolA-binding protein